VKVRDLEPCDLIGSVIQSIRTGNKGVISRTHIDVLDGALCVWVHWLGSPKDGLEGAHYEMDQDVLIKGESHGHE
jgi:hypothetical protein